MRINVCHRIGVSFIAALLASCGTYVPNIAEIGDRDVEENQVCKAEGLVNCKHPKITATAQIEYEIVEKIFCSLKKGVRKAYEYPVQQSSSQTGTFKTVYNSLFPSNWGAQVSLSLEVDEASALTPGVAVSKILPNAVQVFGPGTTGTVSIAQSLSLGFGGALSSTATRIDKFNPYWSIKDLSTPEPKNSSCDTDLFVAQHIDPAKSSPFVVIENDLGIEDWLVDSMWVNDNVPSSPQKTSGTSGGVGGGAGGGGGGGQKPESISIEIKFIIVTSGTVTPTWKLVNVSANTGSGALFGAGRTRTHDLIITVGPNSDATRNSHLASQVSSGINAAARAAGASP